MPQQRRSARLAASALSLLVTVLALLVPSSATVHGAPGDGRLTHHTVAAHAGKRSGPEDVPALRVTVVHRLDTHIPAPQPPASPRTSPEVLPPRPPYETDARAASRVTPHQAIEAAAPRGPPPPMSTQTFPDA
ncbi:hypothetical protein [Streptomyces sp. NRRL S-1521]|uniref:hypothetical protein n=1 Tax=Streptomyces sp. NRRL S-1521 TaxID=1609100 RepID=UPI00131E5593|nr:hypothetical protein [Streptomyces sp. NRRL S-1521]